MACYTGLLLWHLFLKLDSDVYPVKTYSDLMDRIFGSVSRHVTAVLQSIQLIINVGTICLSNGQSLSQITKGHVRPPFPHAKAYLSCLLAALLRSVHRHLGSRRHGHRPDPHAQVVRLAREQRRLDQPRVSTVLPPHESSSMTADGNQHHLHLDGLHIAFAPELCGCVRRVRYLRRTGADRGVREPDAAQQGERHHEHGLWCVLSPL